MTTRLRRGLLEFVGDVVIAIVEIGLEALSWWL